MKWMSEKYVKEQEPISDEAALLCSIEHYDQMLSASESEFQKGLAKGVVSIGSTHCALCQRRHSTNKCVMENDHCDGKECFSQWRHLFEACYSWRYGRGPWLKVREGLVEVRRVLREKYEEVCREREKVSKVAAMTATEVAMRMAEIEAEAATTLEKERVSAVMARQEALKKAREEFTPIDVCHLRVSIWGKTAIQITPSNKSRGFRSVCPPNGCLLTWPELEELQDALQKAWDFINNNR